MENSMAADSAAIQIFQQGTHLGLVLTYWSGWGGGNTTGYEVLEGAPDDWATHNFDLNHSISEEMSGKPTARLHVYYKGVFGLGASLSGTKKNPIIDAHVEFLGTVPDAQRIWGKMLAAADFVNSNPAQFPYYYITASCQTTAKYLSDKGGLNTILPTDANFNMMFAPGVYFPIGDWLKLVRFGSGDVNPNNPALLLGYSLFALAQRQYKLDNELHWAADGRLYNLIEAGYNGPEKQLFGPYNTVPVGKGNIIDVLFYPPQFVNFSSLDPQSRSDPFLTEFQPAIAQQVSFVNGINSQLQHFLTIDSGNSAVINIATGICQAAAPNVVGQINLGLPSGGQLSTIMGAPTGHATLDGSAGHQALAAFGGNNVLIAGAHDELFGGPGSNTFVFGSAALAAAQNGTPSFVLDYDQAQGSANQNVQPFVPMQGDTLDISALVGGAFNHGNGQAVNSLVRIIEDPSNTFANLEIANGGTWITISQLYGLHLGDPVSVVLDPTLNPTTVVVQADASTSSVPIVTTVAASTDHANVGQSVQITVTMSKGLLVSSQYLYLGMSDGSYATYDPTISNLAAGVLGFTYTTQQNRPDLETTYVYTNNGYATVTDTQGNLADFSMALDAYTGLQVGPVTVDSVAPSNYGSISAAGDMVTGQAMVLTLTMTGRMTVDTSKGMPTLLLNDGGAATYDAQASKPANGILVFDYTAGATDYTTQLATSSVNLNGATILDAHGQPVNFSGVAQTLNFNGLEQLSTATMEVNAVFVTGLALSQTTEVQIGANLNLTLSLSQGVSVDTTGGLPTLSLNNGTTATYDANASQPSQGRLVFDYTVGPNDATADLGVDSVNLPAMTRVTDANGNPVDFSYVTNGGTGVQVGPATAVAVYSDANAAHTSQTVHLTVVMSQAVTVAANSALPTLSLSDGGTASYDANASDPSQGNLVFDYVVGSQEQAKDLMVTKANLPAGTTVQDSSGVNVDFSSALNTSMGLTINSPLTVTSLASSVNGAAKSGDVVNLMLTMSQSPLITLNDIPTLSLNDGGTASYVSKTQNVMTFKYTVGVSDQTPDLQITGVNLHGSTVLSGGFEADFSNAFGASTGTQVTTSIPVLTALSGSVVYAANAPAVQVAPSIELADAGSSTIASAMVLVVDGTFQADGDVLAANTTGTAITATYDSTGEILLLSGRDSIADYQKVLSSVTFAGSAQDATGSNISTERTVEWAVYDGANVSATPTTTIQITLPLTAPPVISSISTSGIGITNGTGHLDAGKTVGLTVTMSEAVTVAGGTPSLALNDGGTATFDAAHSTSTSLFFTYTTAQGENTNDLIVSSLNPNGSTIQDAAGNNADLSGASNFNPAGILQIDTHIPPAFLPPLQVWTTPEQQAEAVYTAFFARAGDSAGLNFWMGNLDAGQSIFDVALNFSKSAEAQNIYSFLKSPSTDDDGARVTFINSIYAHLFNRTSDSAGLSYWDNQLHRFQTDLANGVGSPAGATPPLDAADYFSQRVGNFIMNIIGGAQNSAAGQDITTIQNKVTVATYFSDQLAFHNISYANNQPVTIDNQAHSLVANTDSSAGSVATQKAVVDADIASDLANHAGAAAMIVGLTTVHDFQTV
jgi:hypothetical protein